MTSTPENDVLAGQAVYSKSMLAFYDFLVLGVSNRWIWKCPTPRLLEFYNEHVSANHLDIGVGTGYFLDRCKFPSGPRIVLLDLNSNSLEATAARIRRYQPKTHRGNVLEPLDLDESGFDSIGMNYLFHCLPGDIHSKAIVFDHINEHLNPGGIVFGSTLVQGDAPRNAVARRLMKLYNKKRIFSNTRDTLEGLREELFIRYSECRVELIGCAALFWARK